MIHPCFIHLHILNTSKYRNWSLKSLTLVKLVFKFCELINNITDIVKYQSN